MTTSGSDPDRGVYSIAVAAELVGSGPQNLRQYEARGLLSPDRTSGGTRRYSENDLHRLREIATLLEAGLNLAGIEMVLALRTANRPTEGTDRGHHRDTRAVADVERDRLIAVESELPSETITIR